MIWRSLLVVACLRYELRATLQGVCSAERDLQKMDVVKIAWRHILFNPRWRTWSTFSHHSQWWNRNTSKGTQSSLVSHICLCVSHICDGRDCELLNSMTTRICTRNRNRPNSKMQNVLGRTKPPEQKGCKFGGAWRMNTYACIRIEAFCCMTHEHINMYGYMCLHMFVRM